MSTTVNAILNEARKHIGVKEGSSKHHAIIDAYNAHKPLAQGYKVKYSDNWCATFISFLAIKCGATDIIPTECGCERMIDLFKKKGIWEENDNIKPKAGYIIMYDWDKKDAWADHVGIVENISGNMITVIEGNKNDAVARRSIEVGSVFIRGYGKPKYKEEANTSKPAKTYLSKGDEGNDVKEMQKMLIACGYSCGPNGADGDFGSNTDKALRKFQDAYGLEVDGKYGTKSKAKLNEVYKNKTTVSYYKEYTGKSNKIDVVFKTIGVPSAYIGSYSKRKPVAKKNGISNYTGTSSQNLKLISLAKQGKLKKA